jgi:hypothetical protein
MTVITHRRSAPPREAFASPFAFFTPTMAIIRREVGRMLGERAFRILVIGMSLANVLIAYSQYTGPDSTNEITKLILVILMLQGSLLYAVGFVFTAARAGTCIGTERARDTWTMMWLTPAHPMSIALGHIAAALAPGTFLTLSQLPLLAPLLYVAGTELWPRIATATLIAYTSWVACAAWAFWASAQFRQFGPAIAGAFIAAIWASGIASFMLTGMFILFSSWNSPTGNPSFLAANILKISSPIMQLYYVVYRGFLGTPVLTHIVFMLTTALIPFGMGARAVRHEKEAQLRLPRKRLLDRLRGHGTSQHSVQPYHPIANWKNPIYAIERKIAIAARARLGRVLFFSFMLYAAYVSYVTLHFDLVEGISIGIAILFIVGLAMAAWSTASGSAASREHQTFDMVSMTGMRASVIQRGKILSALSSVTPVTLLIAVSMAAGALIIDEVQVASVVFVTYLICIATLLSSGLFASVVTRGTREAIATNVLIGLIMHFGMPILSLSAYAGFQRALAKNWLGLQRWFGPPEYDNDAYNFVAGCSSPITGLMQLTDNPGEPQRWIIWASGMSVALAWVFLWYTIAGWLLQRALEGRPVQAKGAHSTE